MRQCHSSSRELLAGLDVLKDERGAHAESIRRAITAYLAEKGGRGSSKTRNPNKRA
jgi:hypothetical protein